MLKTTSSGQVDLVCEPPVYKFSWSHSSDLSKPHTESAQCSVTPRLHAASNDLTHFTYDISETPRLRAAMNDTSYLTHDTSEAHADSSCGAAAQYCDSELCAAFNVFHEIYQEDKLEHANILGNIYGYNPTTEWSATLSAGDAPQRNAPGRTNSTSGWSAMLSAGDALQRTAPGRMTHDQLREYGPQCSNTTLIRGGPAVSQKWAAMAHREPAELHDVELLLLQNVQAEFLFQDGPRERGGPGYIRG